jgi:hypothetical protein
MSENNTDQTNNQGADSGGLRDVPGDIGEYKKFVADGGLDHNQKLIGREAAVAAAKAAGILPNGDGEEQYNKLSRFDKRVSIVSAQRVGKLQREIGRREAQIAELEKRVAATAAAAAPPQNGNHAPAAAKPAAEEAHTAKPNGEAKEPPRPKEEDFKTYSEFVEALADWKTDRKLEAREAKSAEERARADAENKGKAITDAHAARVDEAKTRYPDWDKAFKGLDDNSFTDPMVVFIFESEKGPDVTHYLATHRDELERIGKLSPVRQVAALSKIEDQFGDAGEGEKPRDEEEEEEDKPGKKPDDDDEEEEERKPAKPAPRASKAPPPVKASGGRGAPDDGMPDPKDFAAYAAWSKRQAAKGVKR